MTVEHNTKEQELKLLLKMIFPQPVPGNKETLVAFEIGRMMDDHYCLGFNELGYTKDYKQFESDRVLNAIVSLLHGNDDRLASFVEKYWEKVLKHSAFHGEYYTFYPRVKEPRKALRFGSDWSELRKYLDRASVTFGEANVKAYLTAVWEATMDLGKRMNNFVLVRQLFKEHGGKESFLVIASRLNSFGIIEYYKAGRGVDISIGEELIPFVADALHKDP